MWLCFGANEVKSQSALATSLSQDTSSFFLALEGRLLIM